MKKIYTLLVAMVAVSVSVQAQKKPLTIPVHNYPEHYFESLNQSVNESPDQVAPDVVVKPLSQTTPRAGGTIWSEDFGNGFPAGWAVDDISGINPWKWHTEGSHGYWNSNNNGAGFDPPINSTTAANGFLISDPDSANHFNYGQPSGTTYEYLESYFATSEIELGATYPSLLLEFEQSFRFNNSVDLNVQVSPDSVNWTTFTVQGGVDNNDASADPDLVSVNISGAIGTSTSVYLRIGWSARVYWWMIDDMRIVEGLGNDLELTKAYHGDIVLDYQYSKIPLEQATEMVIGAVVTNLGGVTQTGVTVNYDIQQNSSSVSTGSFSFPTDMVAADVDTVWHSTGFTASSTGDYEVLLTVSSDQTDENTTNDAGSSAFEVTDHVFAHDYDDAFDVQVWGQADVNGDANPYGHGNVFVVYNPGSTIYALEAAFGSNTTDNTSIIAEVHELGTSIQDIVDSYQSVFDIEASHVNGGSNFFFTTIVLEDEVALNAGSVYTIALQSEGVDDEMWLLGNTGDEDFSTTLYGPYGTGGAVNWYNGWGHTPALRANLNPNIAGIEESIEQEGYAIFPNPATNIVTIKLAENNNLEKVQVLDLAGKLVMQMNDQDVSQTTNSLTVDVSDLTSGIYFINVHTPSGVSSSKLVVE